MDFFLIPKNPNLFTDSICRNLCAKVIYWVICVAFFAVLSAGRYDWGPGGPNFAITEYALHLFFAALFFPALYYVLADLHVSRGWRRGICTFLGVVYAFPHHWLGTDRSLLLRHGMAFSQGATLYVTQPKIYILAIAGVAILLALQQRLFEPRRFRPGGALLFGSVCALYMLSYQSQPWLFGLALVAYLRGYSLRWTFFSLALAFTLCQAVALLLRHLPPPLPLR